MCGNCDSFLYLGGNEQSTHKYVSELLGKETIDTNTYGKSTGHSGNYSTNYQNTGRELLTPDEVRMLDNKYALLFVRGERAIRDFKYNILSHPNVNYTTDGKGEPYIHGETLKSSVSLTIRGIRKKNSKNEEGTNETIEASTEENNKVEKDYVILNEVEIERYIEEENLYEKRNKSK